MTLLQVRDVHYHIYQEGDGKPLLLLHGFTGSHDNWLPYADDIQQAGYRVLAPDLLGHGLTDIHPDPWRYQMAQVASDVVALLQTLNIKQTALLGYSMGGRLALYLARHYPQYFSHVVLESASPGLVTEGGRMARKRRDDLLADAISYEGIVAFVKRWEKLPMWASQQKIAPEIRNALHGQRIMNDPIGLANSLRGMGTGVQPSLWDDLKSIRLPTLLMTGSLDEKFTQINQYMAMHLPYCEHIVVENAGHTVHLEKPSVFWQKTFGFLGKNE
jgi:2-succinyl-6-hydroxy-2,4-cyclohexadiene-1-carboxylate synthase